MQRIISALKTVQKSSVGQRRSGEKKCCHFLLGQDSSIRFGTPLSCRNFAHHKNKCTVLKDANWLCIFWTPKSTLVRLSVISLCHVWDVSPPFRQFTRTQCQIVTSAVIFFCLLIVCKIEYVVYGHWTGSGNVFFVCYIGVIWFCVGWATPCHDTWNEWMNQSIKV